MLTTHTYPHAHIDNGSVLVVQLPLNGHTCPEGATSQNGLIRGIELASRYTSVNCQPSSTLEPSETFLTLDRTLLFIHRLSSLINTLVPCSGVAKGGPGRA